MEKDNILKKSKEVGQCPESYQKNGFCLSYFFENFNIYQSVLHIEKQDYINEISNFPDPLLKYVALYLYHNYAFAQNYIKEDSNKNNNAACAVLNRWLDQQKNFYTEFGKSYYNRLSWDISIEPLWEKLKGYYSGKTCERFYSYYYKKSKHSSLHKIDRCYQQIPEEFVCYKENNISNGTDEKDENSIKENCAKLSILFDLCKNHSLFIDKSTEDNPAANTYCTKPYKKINYNPVLKAEKLCNCDSLINTIALPICVTFLGTIFLAFFLNEFTPIGSKLRIRSKNKVRLREQFNEEAAYKEYKTYRNNKQNTPREKNIIYYQSMNG